MTCRLPTNFIRWQDKSARHKGHMPHPPPLCRYLDNATEPKILLAKILRLAKGRTAK